MAENCTYDGRWIKTGNRLPTASFEVDAAILVSFRFFSPASQPLSKYAADLIPGGQRRSHNGAKRTRPVACHVHGRQWRHSLFHAAPGRPGRWVLIPHSSALRLAETSVHSGDEIRFGVITSDEGERVGAASCRFGERDGREVPCSVNEDTKSVQCRVPAGYDGVDEAEVRGEGNKDHIREGGCFAWSPLPPPGHTQLTRACLA